MDTRCARIWLRRGTSTVTVGSAAVHNLGLATLLGPVPASQPVTVGVFLKNPNQAAEDAFVKQLYDPASPSFHDFLDPDTFNQRFGVPATTTQAAQAWLQSAGLSVSSVEGSTQYLLATGTAAQMAAAFSTPFNRYSSGGYDGPTGVGTPNGTAGF